MSQAIPEEAVEDDFHQFEDISLNELQGIEATERSSQASTISGGANSGIFTSAKRIKLIEAEHLLPNNLATFIFFSKPNVCQYPANLF
jgi:hypothetical protein